MDFERGRKPGQWWPLVGGSAICYCEKCGQPMNLSAHTILPDGTVNPSVVCPYFVPLHDPVSGKISDAREPYLDCQQCGFHNYIRLVGWMDNLEANANYPDR